MKKYPLSNLLLTLAATGLLASAAAEVPPAAALAQLTESNARFVARAPVHPHLSGARREETATAQKPFAVILGCADSRTGPELVFDQGIGDLFVVRLAGNIADEAALGSIEFAPPPRRASASNDCAKRSAKLAASSPKSGLMPNGTKPS